MTDGEKRAQYFFHRVRALSNKKLKKLLKYAGSFEKAFEISEKEFLRNGVFKTDKEVESIKKAKTDKNRIFEEYENLKNSNTRYIADGEETYPRRLLDIPDRPIGIFIKGELPDDNTPTASVIGARACSEYGKGVAELFGEKLAAEGVGIVSGLAAGIDSHAQRGAVKARGKTYAVLGCGVNICYPKENYYLYRRIEEYGGGIISEYPPDTEPLAANFPQRNRIISGFGDCLLVLEARERSGTSITVDFALEQGKEVFALPGRITDSLGRGCNELIKNGAAILTEPRDVLDYLKIPGSEGNKIFINTAPSLAKSEKTVYAFLDLEPRHAEEIAEKAGMRVAELVGILLELEMKGLVKEAPKFYYAKRMI